MSLLERNVTDLLQAFGGMSREDINVTLHQLDGNLSNASEVFDGAQYNLGEKTAQLDRVSTDRRLFSVNNFELLSVVSPT